jgi:hypothetical protein
MVPMSFLYASVTCRGCAAVTYYHREIGVSARQITLLTGRVCERCGHRSAVAQASRTSPPLGSTVLELPDDDSIV